MIINCRKCKQDKAIEDFPKHKTSRLGVEKQCKKCKSKNGCRWQLENKDKRRTIYQKYNDSEYGKLKREEYYTNNKERIIKRVRKYTNDRPWIKAWRSTLRNTLTRMRQNKETSSVELLGYSLTELRIHLESKFTDKMNWNNYGTEWVVDHIKPVSKFNKDTDIKIVCALENLQPLNKLENLRKYNKYGEE